MSPLPIVAIVSGSRQLAAGNAQCDRQSTQIDQIVRAALTSTCQCYPRPCPARECGQFSKRFAFVHHGQSDKRAALCDSGTDSHIELANQINQRKLHVKLMQSTARGAARAAIADAIGAAAAPNERWLPRLGRLAWLLDFIISFYAPPKSF